MTDHIARLRADAIRSLALLGAEGEQHILRFTRATLDDHGVTPERALPGLFVMFSVLDSYENFDPDVKGGALAFLAACAALVDEATEARNRVYSVSPDDPPYSGI